MNFRTVCSVAKAIKVKATSTDKCRKMPTVQGKDQGGPCSFGIVQSKEKGETKKYIESLTEEQKALKREKDRIRQQEYRYFKDYSDGG